MCWQIYINWCVFIRKDGSFESFSYFIDILYKNEVFQNESIENDISFIVFIFDEKMYNIKIDMILKYFLYIGSILGVCL